MMISQTAKRTASRAFFGTQVVTQGETSSDHRPDYKVPSREELSDKYITKDKSGFNNPELDALIESGVENEARREFFLGLSQVSESDHPEAVKVKNKIREMIEHELEFANFKEEVSKEQERQLLEETTKEVDQRSSFFFPSNLDLNKVTWNTEIHDFDAPGNRFKHESVVLPHEHVHPQHYFDIAALTPEKEQEIYGLYSYLVDLHISQIRPNLREHSYIPPQFNQLATMDSEFRQVDLEEKFFEFYHRFRADSKKDIWRSQTQDIDFEAEKAALPINDHPDDRGTINDVEWTNDQKFPHVANRLGYPEFGISPFEKIIGFEHALSHPSYQFQPFVQTPSIDPDPTLNFERGEVIYENTRVGEWTRFWRIALGATLPFWPAFYTFEFYQNDGVPSLKWLSDWGMSHRIPMQLQDQGGWGVEKIRYVDDHNYMNIQYAWKRAFARPIHTFYQATVLVFLLNLSGDYATRVTYNRDKDLVFVDRPDGIFKDKEHVYEVHHLEQMVPAPVTAFKDIGGGKKDGVLTLHCMNTKDYIKLYNEPKYWNLDQREDLLSQTRSLWTEVGEKYQGRLFTEQNSMDEEQWLLHTKTEGELKAAVEKLGEARVPGYYPDE